MSYCMGFALDEVKEKIVKYVQNHQDDEGYHLTQNRVKDAIIKDGGSPNTFTQAFKELLDSKRDGRLQRMHVKKKIYVLALSDKEEKLTELKIKIKQAKNLIGLLEKNPSIGDIVFISESSEIPNLDQYNYDQMKLHGQAVTHFRIDETPFDIPVETKCLQARYDILNNLPLFLVHYINMSQTGFSNSMKDESREMINPIIDKCISLVERDYTNSPYYSKEFAKKYPSSNPGIYLCKGLPLNDIRFEFLRILGRYYFMVSNKFSTKYRIDSCKEQKIITDFVTSFFPKSPIKNDELDKSIDKNSIIDFQWGSDKALGKKIIDRIRKISKSSDGAKFSTRYEYYGHNDPFIISNYYIEWIFGLELFSKIEKTIIQTNFDESEDYEEESKSMNHEDAYEERAFPFKKEIKGQLRRTKKGNPIITLDESYSKMRPFKGRRVRILIEDAEQ